MKLPQLSKLPAALLWFFFGILIVTVIAAVVFQSTSPRVLYASQMGCSLNSDVINGGGTDDSAALQSALNLASAKGYKLIVDGPALISTNLILRSNTELEFLEGAGLFMAPHSSCWVLGNAQNTNFTSTNIFIRGGILNCNGNNQNEYVLNGFQNSGQPGVWGLWFAGVDGLKVRDTKVLNCKTYAILFSDSRNGLFENITCQWTNNAALTNTYYGTDSFHSQGNVTNLHINGLINIRGNDDTFALMTDETDLTLNVNDPRWTLNSGAMKNILIENVFLLPGADGTFPRNVGKMQRISSTNAIVENVTIRNVQGRVLNQGLLSIDTAAAYFKAKNIRIDGFHVIMPSNIHPAIDLAEVSCDSIHLNDIGIDVSSGSGGGGVWYVSLGCRNTNVFVSNAYFIGSAGGVAAGDVCFELFEDPFQTGAVETNSPMISMENVTARSMGALLSNDGFPNGVVRMSNMQLYGTPNLNTGAFTNIETGTLALLQTNMLSGVWYTNATGQFKEVRQVFTITSAAVLGSENVFLITGVQGAALGTWVTNATCGGSTTIGSLVVTNSYQLSWNVAPGLIWCFTNQLVGAGNAITPRPGTGQIVTY